MHRDLGFEVFVANTRVSAWRLGVFQPKEEGGPFDWAKVS